ncbi:MAG: DUF2283 domain-containing protein [Phycisphaerae bacterium]|nr:DUF2283 domain-containing protein [Phycisphaerae bacterium]
MVVTDTLEGTVDTALWYHYDMTNDVLYLRLASERQTPTISEETPDGFLLLRRESDGQPVGLTVVNWWRRFGKGDLPDSIKKLEHCIEPWAKKVAA